MSNPIFVGLCTTCSARRSIVGPDPGQPIFSDGIILLGVFYSGAMGMAEAQSSRPRHLASRARKLFCRVIDFLNHRANRRIVNVGVVNYPTGEVNRLFRLTPTQPCLHPVMVTDGRVLNWLTASARIRCACTPIW